MMYRLLAAVAGAIAAVQVEFFCAGTPWAHAGLFVFGLVVAFIFAHLMFNLRQSLVAVGTVGAMTAGFYLGSPEMAIICGVPSLLFIWRYHGWWPALLMGTTALAGYQGWCLGGSQLAIIFGVISPLLMLAVFDIFQWKHSLRRAFPLVARIRWILEGIRPEIQQYFIERDTDPRPQGTIEDWGFCIGASKGVKELHEVYLGTKRDYHKPGQIHIQHDNFPLSDDVPINFAPLVLGGTRRNADGSLKCRQPAFLFDRFGISDMSFGSLGMNAVQSLASGAGRAGVMLSTGEGSITPYHLNGVYYEPSASDYAAWAVAYGRSFFSKNWRRTAKPKKGYLGSGQIMWEIGTAKFGCRTANGEFDWERFAKIAANPKITAIKIKISQGAKPTGGGLLPGHKVTPEIAEIRAIPVGVDCKSPNTWKEFAPDADCPHEEREAQGIAKMMAFIKRMQEVSGKPVGIKFCLGKESYIETIAQWLKSNPNEGPDFIHLDGGEGGTGAAPLPLADFVGKSILMSLPTVDNCLRKHGVRDRLVLMSSGKVFNPAQLFIQLALGADYVFGARGYMNALGCIGAKKCGLNTCPTGVATQDRWLQRALVPRVKYIRVANYAEVMHMWLKKLLRTVAKRDTWQLTRDDISMVVGMLKEMDGSVVVPYPEGCGGVRQNPPIPATYGIAAPAKPPELTVVDPDLPWVPEPVAEQSTVPHQLFAKPHDHTQFKADDTSEPQIIQISFTRVTKQKPADEAAS
jgi:glutamate synthase domain-containing protein 2